MMRFFATSLALSSLMIAGVIEIAYAQKPLSYNPSAQTPLSTVNVTSLRAHLQRRQLSATSRGYQRGDGRSSGLVSAPIYLAQSTVPSIDSIEKSVLTQINQYRKSKGLSALSLDSRISQQARTHSENMASGKVPFGHNGFSERVKAIASSIPYRAAAENVAYNQGYKDPATQAVQGWLKSAGHRTNIEGQYNLTGIGVAKNSQGAYYFTQIFIRSR